MVSIYYLIAQSQASFHCFSVAGSEVTPSCPSTALIHSITTVFSADTVYSVTVAKNEYDDQVGYHSLFLRRLHQLTDEQVVPHAKEQE